MQNGLTTNEVIRLRKCDNMKIKNTNFIDVTDIKKEADSIDSRFPWETIWNTANSLIESLIENDYFSVSQNQCIVFGNEPVVRIKFYKKGNKKIIQRLNEKKYFVKGMESKDDCNKIIINGMILFNKDGTLKE